MNTPCPLCGGYIGTVDIPSSGSIPTIRFCPGHPTTVTDIASHSIRYTGVVPQGTSISPASLSQHEETLWEIVQEVAEGDPLHEHAGRYYCNYCDERQSSTHLFWLISELSIEEDPDDARAEYIRQFPHDATCIVTKARELMEWRKAQPKITVEITGTKVPRD